MQQLELVIADITSTGCFLLIVLAYRMASFRLNAIIGDNIVAGGNNLNEKAIKVEKSKEANIYGVVPKRPISPMMTKLYNTKYIKYTIVQNF